jgi:hypothetical protein
MTVLPFQIPAATVRRSVIRGGPYEMNSAFSRKSRCGKWSGIYRDSISEFSVTGPTCEVCDLLLAFEKTVKMVSSI